MIYTLDHAPAHVHVTGAGHAKINLLGADGLPEVIYSVGIPRPVMRRLVAEATAQRGALLPMWEQIHGRAD